MQHRIILSTDLLIAVRGKLNTPDNFKIKPSIAGIQVLAENIIVSLLLLLKKKRIGCYTAWNTLKQIRRKYIVSFFS